jgi:hypothetical protein
MRLKHQLSRLLLAAAVWSLSAAAMAQADDDWITVKAGTSFTFEAPADLKPVPVQGIDSFVGQYANAKFSLMFDYGQYSNRLEELRGNPQFEAETTVIDGRKAEIFTGPGAEGCDFVSAVYIVVREPIALNMTACANGYAGVVQLHRLFKSLKFSTPPT